MQRGNLLRIRLIYSSLLLVILILGISSRKFSEALPVFIAEHAGDVLWASLIYFGIRLLHLHGSRHMAVAISLLFCFMIEISQLYQAAWIIEIRNTILGALVLGHSFLAVDLVRYTVGILLAFGLDGYLIKRIQAFNPDKTINR